MKHSYNFEGFCNSVKPALIQKTLTNVIKSVCRATYTLIIGFGVSRHRITMFP